MAEEALKKLEEQLKCYICLDTYTDPKLLQCFHVYCRQCLVPLVDRDQQGQLGISCPACRQVTPIPDRGVAGLQPAFHINNLLELRASFLKLAATPEGAAKVPDNLEKKFRYCFEHCGVELGLHCETCGELVCAQCVVKGGKHHDHDCAVFERAFEKYKEEITSSLEPMEKQVMTIKKALTQLDVHCGEISDQQKKSKNIVHVTFRHLREVLYIRETDLIRQVDKMTQEKLKDLAAQRDQIETTLAQLHSCLHFMRESLRPGNEGDVLMMKANTVRQVNELTTPFQPDFLEPNTQADMVFLALADMTAVCQNYGQVFSLSSPDPSKCRITGKRTEITVVGEKSTAVLQSINFEGKPCEEPIKSLECELVSEIAGSRASCSVERRGQSQYEISYQPTIKGRHQLLIKVQGQHIRGSPFSLAVRLPVKKLGDPILTVDGVGGSLGVAVNQMGEGEVVVAEYHADCVSLFNPSGKKLRSFGKRGSGQGEFVRPHGVAVDGEGNILVADCGNDRIQKFSKILSAVDTVAVGPRFCPSAIAVNPRSRKVYVMDWDSNCIRVLNSDLTLSSTFGKYGKGKGQFSYPRCIACDSTGIVYVADTGNHRIQVFTAEGKFLRMFGKYGLGKGELDQPQGVAVDSDGMVYVSEGQSISVFTSKGRFVTSFGEGLGPPQGVAVNDNGVVYVCYDDCIRVF